LRVVTTLAGVISLVALGAVIASLGYLHLAPTGLSPVRNAVSQYGITSFRAGYRVATVAFALSALALALGLHRALQRNGQVRIVIVLLVVFAVARALISWFPMDAPGTPRTATGGRHGLLAIAAFLAATIAAFRLGSALSDGTRWHSLAAVSTALGWAMLACLLAMAFGRGVPRLRARFGAIERGFYVSAIAWFAVFGVACITGS
jgi:hypothetical protein